MKCLNCGGEFNTPFGIGDTCHCSKTQRRLASFLERQDLDAPRAPTWPFWLLSLAAAGLVIYGCSLIGRGVS